MAGLAVATALPCFWAGAQQLQWTYSPENVKKKAMAVYREAMARLEAGEMDEGGRLLTKAIAADSNFVDAYISLAGVFGEKKEYAKSIVFFEKARQKDSVYFRKFYLPYSIDLAGTGQFEKAYRLTEQYLDNPMLDETTFRSVAYRNNCYAFGAKFAKDHPRPGYVFDPINMGDSVNGPRPEYFPTMTVDDSMLVFTRREHGGEYFYRSHVLPNGKYALAKKIEGALNEEAFKGAISVSADGEWMVFAGNIQGKTFGDYDIFISYAGPDGWSEPQNIGEAINSPYWESSPSLSPDKRTLYFTSTRPGGLGGADIYRSQRDAKGRWGQAENMGPDMNTKGDDQAPFLHADNKTMYYSSNGLPGYGGSDLYVVRKDDNGRWGKPENLGFPINTIENEGSLSVAPNGTDAFYASDRADSRGLLDLYTFTLSEDVRPSKTLYVKGFVYDENTKKGLPSNVALVDAATGTRTMLTQTDETGFYFMTLPIGRDYLLQVDRKGYLFHSKAYPLHDKAPDSTYRENIYLRPIALDKAIVLKNVLFDTNDSTIKEPSKPELDKAVQLLSDNPTMRVSVNGHTDNAGTEAANQKLSESRARAVMNYFIAKGIGKNRLEAKGFGQSKPVADNNTEQGRGQNRRTELVVIGL